MASVPDLVHISKLETRFYSDPEYTQHIQYVASGSTKQRNVRKEEKWKRENMLARGGFSTVWLERRIDGDSKGEVRAVKKIQKLNVDYYRELEAMALFSHVKYERCFVKSFGWYDDDVSIFIAMEYLPHGDLQQYLSSPLLEKEGQQICFQILEGLQFMHEIGYAHRDLKPANILVMCQGPDWWVKIADLGISKRATEGVTALRTQIGTPAYAAPEVLGYFQLNDRSNESYTNAVDIWSLGVIVFLILTSKALFKDQRRLGQYVTGSFKFPLDILLENKSEDRPTVKKCLSSQWLYYPTEPLESQREINISKSSPTLLNHLEPEPSNSWSTQDQISAHETHRPTAGLAENATSALNKSMAESTLEPAIHTYWTPQRTLTGHSDEVSAIAFSPDGKQIASASGDKTVRLWDSATGTVRDTLRGHLELISAIAFSPDGKQIVSASWDKTVRLWDLATGAPRDILKGHSGSVLAIAFSPDGKQIVSASSDYTVRLWDSATGTARRILRGHLGLVSAIAFSPDGKQIASASWDKTVRLWDSATGAARGILKGHYWSLVLAVAFSPDGKQIASASYDMTATLWDSATGAARDKSRGRSILVSTIAFSPDGKQIASASWDKTVRLWDSATGTARDKLRGHSILVSAIAFSPDGKQIASASWDKTVRLWDSATGAARDTLSGHSGSVLAIAFSPDGKQIASASRDKTVRLWKGH